MQEVAMLARHNFCICIERLRTNDIPEIGGGFLHAMLNGEHEKKEEETNKRSPLLG